MPDATAAVMALTAMLGGAAIGNFIGAGLVRLLEGRSVLAGRSVCDACSVPIAARDLVPLVSWLVLRGKCRSCGAPIEIWQPFAEMAGALIGAAGGDHQRIRRGTMTRPSSAIANTGALCHSPM